MFKHKFQIWKNIFSCHILFSRLQSWQILAALFSCRNIRIQQTLWSSQYLSVNILKMVFVSRLVSGWTDQRIAGGFRYVILLKSARLFLQAVQNSSSSRWRSQFPSGWLQGLWCFGQFGGGGGTFERLVLLFSSLRLSCTGNTELFFLKCFCPL